MCEVVYLTRSSFEFKIRGKDLKTCGGLFFFFYFIERNVSILSHSSLHARQNLARFFFARTRALGQKAANREGIGTYDENSAMFCHVLLLGSFFCWYKRNPGEFVDLECTYETLGYNEVGDQDFEYL